MSISDLEIGHSPGAVGLHTCCGRIVCGHIYNQMAKLLKDIFTHHHLHSGKEQPGKEMELFFCVCDIMNIPLRIYFCVLSISPYFLIILLTLVGKGNFTNMFYLIINYFYINVLFLCIRCHNFL